MNIPQLEKGNRRREYYSYSPVVIASVVYHYLFEGLSHRALDKKVIDLSSEGSRGWQSMNILHFLGIRNAHKNIFNGTDANTAIESLLEIGTDDAKLIADYIKIYGNKEILDRETFEREFQEQVLVSKHKDKDTLRKDLEKTKGDIPKQVEVISIAFCRNPDVVAAVLERANGFCETCKEKAPFLRAKDNSPYLEVHHQIRLADGGKDNINNAIALCPNCHRKAHFGIKTDV